MEDQIRIVCLRFGDFFLWLIKTKSSNFPERKEREEKKEKHLENYIIFSLTDLLPKLCNNWNNFIVKSKAYISISYRKMWFYEMWGTIVVHGIDNSKDNE